MKDRTLAAEEVPVIWRLTSQEQQTFVQWASRLNWKRARRMLAFDKGQRTKELNRAAKALQLKLFD